MAKIVKNNVDYTSTPSSASMLPYDNFNSGLDATNVQEAIDELAEGGGGGGATSLNQLSDVEISYQTVGQVLKYNGYKWANADESGGDLSNYYTKSETNTLLDDKADVSDLPDMTDYYDKSETDALLAGKADSADVPQNLQDLDNVTVTSATNGQVLKYNGTNWVNANESTGSSSFADLTDVDLSNLQNGQVAKYNSTTQKWENANESGGGSTVSVTQIQTTGTKIATISVDSVDTDLYAPNGGGGASSLDDLTDVTITSPTANQELAYDGNGWENKTTRVELTQIEYDNLVAQGADLPDVDYYITDANGDGSQFQPVIYSEEEREIGVYTDGKPLYQKTFILPSSVTIPKETWTTVANISSLNVDNLVSCIGQPANSQSASVNAYNNAGNLQVFLTFAWSIGVITIQYTKTTDTAGSGTWTPQGVPAHHYSTDEHIVGTWIDRTSVYEKTFIFQEVVIPKETWTTVTDISSLNIDRLVSVFGNGSGASQVASINAFNNNGNLQVFLPFAWGISSITIQYTKLS